jgi:hypothetical protein
MKVLLASSLLILAANSCATGSDKASATRRIIDRSPGVEKTPEWTAKSNKFAAEDNRIGFKGYVSMEDGSRGDACSHAAGVTAKGNIASLISSNIVDESGVSQDEKSIVSSRLTAVLGKVKFSGIEIADEYWQLVEIDDGEKPTRRMECWAKVTIEKKSFDFAMARAKAALGEDASLTKHREKLEKAIETLKAE